MDPMESPLAELDAWWANRGQDEEEFGTTVLRYVEEGESIHIDFETVGGEDTAYPERAAWRLQIDDVEEAVWRYECGEPAWFAEHPLLIPYHSTGALISFAKPFRDPLRAWGAVAQAHLALVGDWFPLERFFRTDLLGDRFGQLASGPERLLAVYANALKSVDESVGYLPTPEWQTKDTALSVMTWGESYSIARSFQLELLH